VDRRSDNATSVDVEIDPHCRQESCKFFLHELTPNMTRNNAERCGFGFWLIPHRPFLKTILLRRTLTKTGFKTLMIFCGRKGANAQQCRALRFWFKKSSLKTTHTKNEIFFLHELRIEQISNPQQCRALRFLVE